MVGLLLVFAVSNEVSAQTITTKTYVIQTPGAYDQAVLENALDNAFMDPYRLKSGNRTLQFDKGAIVILLSADELQKKGIPVNMNLALDVIPANLNERHFAVHPNGHLIEYIDNTWK